jgi:hypothetical protein
VIYRELRDFLSLHAHYRAANLGTSVAGLRTSRRVEIPDFPKMSIPYLNRIAGRDGAKEKPVGKAEYAQASRDALQEYLVELIRAVVGSLDFAEADDRSSDRNRIGCASSLSCLRLPSRLHPEVVSRVRLVTSAYRAVTPAGAPISLA